MSTRLLTTLAVLGALGVMSVPAQRPVARHAAGAGVYAVQERVRSLFTAVEGRGREAATAGDPVSSGRRPTGGAAQSPGVRRPTGS